MSSQYSPQNLNDVSGLVAVVTGGGSGLGLIIANALEANGAKVYITGRRQEKLDEAVKQAVSKGASAAFLHKNTGHSMFSHTYLKLIFLFLWTHGNMTAIQGSTASHEDLQRAVDVVTKETGYIDLLICNAGQTTYDSSPNARPKPKPEDPISDIRDYYFNYRPSSVWSQCLETNIQAVFSTTMAFLELLDAGNKRRDPAAPTSQVITIGSVGGLTRFTDSFIYNASKAGVMHMMKNLGNFLIPHDIRTNSIAPGWFPSDMTVPVQKAWEETKGVMPRSLVPRQRMGTEEELAGTVLYLASKAGGYCNGATMVIDGGVLANHPGPI